MCVHGWVLVWVPEKFDIGILAKVIYWGKALRKRREGKTGWSRGSKQSKDVGQAEG